MKWFRSFTTSKLDMETGLSEGQASNLVNIYPRTNGGLKPIFFKTFRGMIAELKRANKNCKKYNSKVEIRFQLPIKW